MARELRFQLVLFGLRVLRSSTTIGAIAQWRLKEKVLSAALSWFKYAPRWSFGSNILQLKTELRLLADVTAALKVVSFIGAHTVGNVKSLQSREQLLLLLLENEQARLAVWIYPLHEPSKPLVPGLTSPKAVVEVCHPNAVLIRPIVTNSPRRPSPLSLGLPGQRAPPSQSNLRLGSTPSELSETCAGYY
jgi:phosphatidylinositol 4-kinase A